MNRKQFTLLLVLLVVLGGLGWFLRSRDTSAWNRAPGGKILPALPVEAVAQIVIRGATNSTTLVFTNDIWTVRERAFYPANFPEIAEFVRKASDLKVKQTEKVSPTQKTRMELGPPGSPGGGTLVEFRDASSKVLSSLVLGAKYIKKSGGRSPFGDEGGWPAGRYVAVGDGNEALLIDDPLTNIEPSPQSWLNKDFISIERIKSIALTHTNAPDSWKLQREGETNAWRLADASTTNALDPDKVNGMANALQAPSFTDVAVGVAATATGLDKPFVLQLETFDGFRYSVRIGNTGPEETRYSQWEAAATLAAARAPVKDEKPEDKDRLDKEFAEQKKRHEEKLAREKKYAPHVYLVSDQTFEPLLRKKSELFAEEKKPEPKP